MISEIPISRFETRLLVSALNEYCNILAVGYDLRLDDPAEWEPGSPKGDPDVRYALMLTELAGHIEEWGK